ncbi:cytochrome P450 704C1-like [Dioscorea cayenensis subsp. rotundata]|uniref:Cytochrome P450 704C1-like n=1 Tax=Dioscorea cayennensis subsp. rotundata TaxID=55577 RepID=A0AB40B6B4_DIOCR|nr:cytochrome P450 704C1-like [Dioscorea cayenensis subsp. rotundata]
MEFLQAAAAASSLLLLLYVLNLLQWFPIIPSLLKNQNKNKKRNYPPVAGTIFHQLLNLPRLVDFMADISRRHKTFRMLTPSINYVYIVDPSNVEYILKTNFTNYGKGYSFYDVMKDLLGDGIFAVDGEKWRHQRKMASYEFSTKVLRDYSSVVFKTNASMLCQLVSEAATLNQMIDIQDLLMKTTLDSIFKVGFGVELKTLSGTSEEGKAFAKAFDDSSIQVTRRFFDVTWKVKRYLNVGAEAMMKKNIKIIDDFVYKLIDTKLKQLAEDQDDFMKKEDILSRFLIEKEKDPVNMNNRYLRDIILNFMIAGRDTTAGTLSWFLYMLCKHPDVQEKVAEEVIQATNMRDKVPIGEFSLSLTEEVLNKMQYLHAALTETLRLYPAVPLDPKLCSKDDTLPDGFDVREGDMIIYQPYAMGRMKFLWGEDAEVFRPERWLNEDGVFEPENPFKFTAFQAGPRVCLGKEFAYRQMKIFAATLLCYLKFKLWDERKPVKYKTMLTLQIDGGLFLCAINR